MIEEPTVEIEEPVDLPPNPFTIDFNLTSNQLHFILANTPTGEMLYENVTKELLENVQLNWEDTEEVDLTIGNSSGINTFRGIKSGFKLSGEGVIFTQDFSLPIVPKKEILIIMEGISVFEEIHVGLSNDQIFTFQNENYTQIRGDLRHEVDLLITILPEVGGEYISALIPYEDFIETNIGTLEKTINVEDFDFTDVYNIPTPKMDKWIINNHLKINDSQYIRTNSSKFTPINNVTNSVNLFAPKNAEWERLYLEVYNNNLGEQYFFRQVIEELPEELPFIAPDITVISKDSTHFHVQINEPYDLLKFSMVYTKFPSTSLYHWDIYQLPANNVYFELPPVPAEFLEELPFIKTAFDHPYHLTNSVYQINSNELEDCYVAKPILAPLNSWQKIYRTVQEDF